MTGSPFSSVLPGLPAGLGALSCPGWYWIHAEQEEAAWTLMSTFVATQPSSARLLWVAPGRKAQQASEALPEGQGPGRLRYAGYTRQRLPHWLARLAQELQQALPRKRGAPWLVLVALPSDVWLEVSSRRLGRWCRVWRRWLSHQNLTLIFVTSGEGGEVLMPRLATHQQALDGLAQVPAMGQRCRLYHWHNARPTAEADAAPRADRSPEPQDVPEAPANDGTQVLIGKACLAPDACPPDEWQVYEDDEALWLQARQARAATVVLGVAARDEVTRVASRLHALRRTAGPSVKLVVRECAPCLRQSDDKLFVRCGANLVVPHLTPFSRFVVALEGVQGQQCHREVPVDFNRLLRLSRPGERQGCLSPRHFHAEALQRLWGRDPGDEDYLLVMLKPAAGLSPFQALARCQVTRQGDTATVIAGQVYLLLFGCRPSELERTLKRLFGLPAKALFTDQRLLLTAEQIAGELARLSPQALPERLMLDGQRAARDTDDAVTPPVTLLAPQPMSLPLTAVATEEVDAR